MGAQGTTTVDFGAFPGKYDTSVAITGQAAIAAGSLVEAWLFPSQTADHSADEHLVEPIKIMAGNIIIGTGFTIYAFADSPIFEQRVDEQAQYQSASLRDRLGGQAPQDGIDTALNAPRAYGLFTVAWVWN